MDDFGEESNWKETNWSLSMVRNPECIDGREYHRIKMMYLRNILYTQTVHLLETLVHSADHVAAAQCRYHQVLKKKCNLSDFNCGVDRGLV